MKNNLRRRKSIFAGRERGSALLMGLMVMVGLSLLGLGFVAVSQTESAISINERNGKQAQDVAEAGAKAVVEWYQSPGWATSSGLMPANTVTAFKVDRFVDLGTGTPTNIGKYKPVPASPPANTYWCCDKPFKPGNTDRLWGTETTPDIQIDNSTTAGQTFLTAFNNALFPNSATNQDTARITDIRIYAPPIVNGRVNANGFYDGVAAAGTGSPLRYGLATIRVTATKQDRLTGRAAAQRNVRIVISEYPFPGPQGPVQSNANISTGGNMVVHWGKMTSQGTMYVKRPLVGLPWFDAYTRLPIDRGYDSCTVWKTGAQYAVGEVVCPTPAKESANAAVTMLPRCAYEVTVAGGVQGATEPAFESNVTFGGTFTSGTTTYKVRPRPYNKVDPYAPIFADQYPWMYEVQGKSIEDPWVEVRSRGAITNAILAASTPDRTGYFQPFKYNSTTQDILDDPDVGWSNWFELQTASVPREQQIVTFPRIDYDFWKQVAKTGRGTEGVYYFEWVSADNFTNGASTKTFRQWTDTQSGAKAGFYFFDTTNKQNPQVPGANNLTPIVSINGSSWAMSGFIYLNAISFKTTGVQGVDGYYNFPGEPYQDVGFPEVDTSSGTMANYTWTWDTSINKWKYYVGGNGRSAGNGKWDYQDLNGNGKFDVHLTSRTRVRPDGTSFTEWLPDPYVPGCPVGDNATAGATCSEPHEPYLNIVYPQDACCGPASSPNPVMVRWENPGGTITRRPKKMKPGDVMPTVNSSDICTTAAEFDQYCTSNGYDEDGFLDYWAGAQDAPVLNGVFYNEGTFTSTGNARYYGSVLINGDVDPTGTNEVWFDERLVKNQWPPSNWPFPRVLITAIQTDSN